LDVLTAWGQDDRIVWYINDGTPASGEWNYHQVYDFGDQAAEVHTVVAGDMDGDGDMDVLAGSERAPGQPVSGIAWYRYNPNNGLYAPLVISTVANPLFVAAADVNGDGHMDALAASNAEHGADEIYWYNGATGLVGWPTEDVRNVIYNNAPYGSWVSAADMDGDGDVDVLSTSYLSPASPSYAAVMWHENLGGVNPGFATDWITTSRAGALSVFPADIDGDGGLDVISASAADNTVAWYRNLINRPPTIDDAVFNVAENTAHATVVDIVTFDDPDLPDDTLSLAITNGNTGGAFAINSSTGNITVANSAALDFETTPVFNLTVQVTDDDGASDTAAVTVNLIDIETEVALAGGNLTITDIDGGNSADTLTLSVAGSGLVISDPNNAITTSIAGATGDGTNTVTVPLSVFAGDVIVDTLAGDDSVTFGATFDIGTTRGVNVDTGADTDTVNWLATATLASMDVTAEAINLDSGSVNTGTGDQTYNGAVTLGADTTLTGANFSFNGTMDSGGTGFGGFAEAAGSPIATGGTRPSGVAAGDVDGMNGLDLAVTNYGSHGVGVLLNDGSGGFGMAAGAPLTSEMGPDAVAMGDFDGVNGLDLVVANRSHHNVRVFLNDGAGGFTQMVGSPFPVGRNPKSVAVGDFDGVNGLDLATANLADNNVTVLLNNGSGSFVAAAGSPFPAGHQPFSVAVADFDGTNGPDLATANTVSSDVTVLLNDGSAGFSAAPGSPVSVHSPVTV